MPISTKPSNAVKADAGEITKTLRWLARETEFVFAAEQLNAAAALIESMQAQLAEREREIERLDTEIKRWVNKYSQAALNWQQENQECRKLQEEIERMREAQRWIPVTERLPESGEHVLLSCEARPSKKRYACDGFYAAKLSIGAGYACDLDTDYDDEKDEFFLPEGFYEVIKSWDEYGSIVIDDFVTHWMPLPAAPEERHEKEKGTE